MQQIFLYIVEFGTDFWNYTQGVYLSMSPEALSGIGNLNSNSIPGHDDIFKNTFRPPIGDISFQKSPNYEEVAGDISFQNSPDYEEVAKVLKWTTLANVYMKGSSMYEKRRVLKNGMCMNIYPDMVVVPKSTEDVSKIIKTASRYHIPISVRSGGHSYTCQSVKPGSVYD